ncbi:MAG: hypothetical protein P4M07_22585 [Xanthobacteraceae bacterium]|nr:hypothetical protein [Xanthobacteraceae bacterium]
MTVIAAAALGAQLARADESGFYREQPLTARQVAAERDYVSNGSFDWRHRRHGQAVPWYAYSQSGNCYVWTPNAYHYACDPNSRY